MGDTNTPFHELIEDDEVDLLETLAFMMDDDNMNEPQDEDLGGLGFSSDLPSSSSKKAVSDEDLEDLGPSMKPLNSPMIDGSIKNEVSDTAGPSTMAELGLVLSDDEDQPSSSRTPVSSFSAAFSNSKISKNHSEKQNGKSETIDPLEAELRDMESRVAMLRKTIANKKKLEPHQASKFSKLTITPDGTRKTNSRTLSASEESELRKRLEHKSELHAGDTDSEDEEDNRNPMEQRYNTPGREIKHRIAHESKAQRNVSTQKVLINKKESSPGNKGWKKKEGALVTIGKAIPSQNTDQNVTLDKYSGIRIINPLLSQEVMQNRMDGKRMVRLSTITLHLCGQEIKGDWATIGVLVAKGPPKTSQKGSQYCIWKLSDLSDCTKSVSLFLFGRAFKSLWKESVGSVLGILNPSIMKEKAGEKFSAMISLSIFEAERVLRMGMSKDLGWCKGTTKMNEPCKSFVNKASCEFCVYHIQREYQKTTSKRADLQSSFSRVDPKKRLQEKVLGKDQVFYGGQLYTSPSLGNIPKQPKANRAKDLASLSSLKTKMKVEELKAKEFNIPKHLSEGEALVVKDIAQKNEFLSEKLVLPTFGARNLLKHMVKEDTRKKVASGAIRSVSAKDLLDMTHKSILAKKKAQQEKNKKGKSLSSSLSQPSLSLASLSSFEPQLARGVKPGESVDLDIVYPSPKEHSMAMAKALALIKKKGGIKAAEPNLVKNKDKAALPEFQNKVQKRLNTCSVEEVCDPASKKSRLTESVKDDETRSNLGPLDINSDKFKEMLNKKSRHSDLVEVVENEAMDKYYQGLEKREMLEEKLSSVMEISVTAYICIKCRYMSEKASDLCKEENHPLKTVPAKKRFFECKNCKQRTTSLDKLPRKPCNHCEHNSWCRVSMGKIKKGPKLDSEILSLRGDELKHYSASSNQVYLHI